MCPPENRFLNWDIVCAKMEQSVSPVRRLPIGGQPQLFTGKAAFFFFFPVTVKLWLLAKSSNSSKVQSSSGGSSFLNIFSGVKH